MSTRLLATFLALAGSLCADVTVRYKTDFKSPFSAMIPADAMSQLTSFLPPTTTTRVKGTRSYSEFAGVTAIFDSASKQMTLIDAKNKQYVVTDMDSFTSAMAKGMPDLSAAQGAIPDMPKPKIETRDTGATATIQGIEAEEHEMMLSMDAPKMPGMPPMPDGPFLKIVMHVWTPKASEAARVPALREMAAVSQAAMENFSPMGGLQKMMKNLPGFASDTVNSITDLTKNRGVMMRMQVEIFLPGLAGLLKGMPAGANPLGVDLDPNTALAQVSQELVELSTDSVPESTFQVPSQFAKISIDDFAKQWMERLKAPGK